jgi:hypothetical protein
MNPLDGTNNWGTLGSPKFRTIAHACYLEPRCLGASQLTKRELIGSINTSVFHRYKSWRHYFLEALLPACPLPLPIGGKKSFVIAFTWKRRRN